MFRKARHLEPGIAGSCGGCQHPVICSIFRPKHRMVSSVSHHIRIKYHEKVGIMNVNVNVETSPNILGSVPYPLIIVGHRISHKKELRRRRDDFFSSACWKQVLRPKNGGFVDTGKFQWRSNGYHGEKCRVRGS